MNLVAETAFRAKQRVSQEYSQCGLVQSLKLVGVEQEERLGCSHVSDNSEGWTGPRRKNWG